MQQRLVNVVGQGTLPERIGLLTEDVLGHIEIRYHCHSGDSTLPERIREVRRRILDRFEAIKMSTHDSVELGQLDDDLDDLCFVSQVFSYPGDEVPQLPTVERMADTLGKFEEDLIQPTATIRGTRRVTIAFDDPIRVEGANVPRRLLLS